LPASPSRASTPSPARCDAALLDVQDRLVAATGGAVDPLVGRRVQWSDEPAAVVAGLDAIRREF
jgi:hypothetical protein